MENTLNNYLFSINYWNQCRTSPETIIGLIAEGHYFHITREMYEFWQTKNPQYIHAYPAVEPVPFPKLAFLLIDSTSDADPDSVTAENITLAPYNYGFTEMQTIPHFSAAGWSGMNVGILSGLERSFRWILNRKNWVEDTISGAAENGGIFQAIHIPMTDLDSIFNEADANKAVVVFGLKADNTVELLVWSEDFNEHEDAEDVALPIPPFGDPNDYQLLNKAMSI